MKNRKQKYSDSYLKWWWSRFNEAQSLFSKRLITTPKKPTTTISDCIDKLKWFGREL